ncbi:tetratricopeptide repeat protein, partial [bacterium]|nr:tetratricopeptide repeat protein [bacterium]
ARVTLPPMPMQERLQLARALADKHGKRMTDVRDWRPLLKYTQGNPLTLTVVVGQALRDGLKEKEQIKAYVQALRAGQAKFDDEESEGRSRSLGASLGYGFGTAFTESERKQLALLHLFQGFVDVDALKFMGNPEAEWHLPEVFGLTREAGMALLDRAAEIGLLDAHGGGYYAIHPALPWYFRSLFEEHYADRGDAATRAFVEAMGQLGNYYHHEYSQGNRNVIAALTAEEANLLHARRLARANGWWDCILGPMQGLRQLYHHMGRRAEWARLVDEIVPDFVDPDTDRSLPGREDHWPLVTEYRVFQARGARQWPEAERLQRLKGNWCRDLAAEALALPPDRLNGITRVRILTLANSIHELGQIQREQGDAQCVESYREALSLYKRIGDQAVEAVCAFNLGHAYMQIPALCDLDEAERGYQRSLDLRDERDGLGRGKCLGQLGMVAYVRFDEARAADEPEDELLRHINAAARFSHEALGLTPSDALADLATVYGQLGNIYGGAGDLDQALTHYREAVRHFEGAGDSHNAAQTRFNVALHLAHAGQFGDALAYACAALANYQEFGDRADDMIQRTQQLIAEIQQLAAKQEGGGANP